MTFRPLPTFEQCDERLEMLFPKAAFDTVLSNPAAAWSVAALIYVNAVVPSSGDLPADATWARPTTVLWLSTDAYQRADPTSRAAYRDAALGGVAKRQVAALMESWGLPFDPRYGDNSREQIRDETWPKWLDEGAMRLKPGVKTTSSAGRWALTDAFADLFDPALSGDDLDAAVDAYRGTHMSPGGKVKALTARQRGDQSHAVDVTLPNGTVRHLEPGEASVILKGVIEQWAPASLRDPVVLTISEPGDKIYTADSAMIQRLGLAIDQTMLLPDALLVDVDPDPPVFWVVEAVATDGPIDEDRKRSLLKWAAQQRIPVGACRFLTAFGSRNAAPAKRRLKDLATGTFAWYADEPTRELAWYELLGPGDASR
jgi:BsuBI/PstI restriction endonuclease domain/BsuBI/PstI restriction endonuclease HTH domain